MKINLITPEEHDQLLNIYKSFPALTLQNKGYECINKSKLTFEEKEALNTVSSILNNSVYGFSEFSNFKLDKDGNVVVRLQYNWNYDSDILPFIGVGYILLDELLNGF